MAADRGGGGGGGAGDCRASRCSRLRRAKKYWLAAVLLAGVARRSARAPGSRRRAGRALGGETRRLRELVARLDEVGRLLPAGAGRRARQALRHASPPAIAALNARIKELEDQVRDLQEKARGRDDRPPTPRRKWPSTCARPALIGWWCRACRTMSRRSTTPISSPTCCARPAGRRSGRRRRRSSARLPAMGIKLYVRSGVTPPDAARLLIDAFTRFNIPYQSGVTPSDAIPDPATVELFVGPKP